MFWIIFLFIISGALIIYGGLLSGWRYLHFSFLEPIFNGSPVFFQVWCFVMLIFGVVLFILAISLVFARRKRMMKLYEEYIGEQNKKVEEQKRKKKLKQLRRVLKLTDQNMMHTIKTILLVI